jgi:hypothetical protein
MGLVTTVERPKTALVTGAVILTDARFLSSD